MTVIHIYEDNHGLIGVAKDYKSAIDFLIEKDWIDEDTEIEEDWTVEMAFGKDWKNKIKDFSIKKFNLKFQYSFELEEVDVYEKEWKW